MKKNVSIDISSKTLDICIRENGSNTFYTIENKVKSIQSFLRPLDLKDTVISMENTGRYNWQLYEVLATFSCPVFVISPIHLKRSLGLIRGKNDKIDAQRIGAFLEKNISELTPWKPSSNNIRKIKILLTERSSRLKMAKQLSSTKHDYKLMKSLGLECSLTTLNEALVLEIRNQIKDLEEEIATVIKSDTELKKQDKLVQSVPGVGKILTWNFIAKTEGFTTINTPRKFACYSGVVPFEHQSGTSIRGRNKVSQYADKNMKSILHLGAMSAIQHENDLAKYYKRKINDGKNKMSVLNAVRNKIIHRVFAVIKTQKLYEYN
jgi:transposase